MKRKMIEKLPATSTKKKGLVATVQGIEDILILNIYENKEFLGRYCINTETHEFEQWNAKDKKWGYGKLPSLRGYDPYYSSYRIESDLKFNSSEEEELAKKMLKITEGKYPATVAGAIDSYESEYSSDKREKTENNRIKRVQAVMDSIPKLPAGIRDWIYERAAGSKDFVFFDKEDKKWQCTNCGRTYEEKYLHRIDGGEKIRHNDMVTCPRCRKVVQVKKRTQKQELKTHFMLLQPVNDRYSVARHFDVFIRWGEGKRKIVLNEAVRFTLNKLSQNPKYACDIYYNQYNTGGIYCAGSWDYEYAYFDNKKNTANRQTFAGWLYEEGIAEALEDTAYESWTRLFQQMAAVGKMVQYNRLMAIQKDEDFQGIIEYLFKGRFDRLLLETTEHISYWSCNYYGPLHKGTSIEDVFDIKDRQKINRIRDLNGDEEILHWMRWSDKTGEKIPQEVLFWLTQSGISRDEVEFIIDRMSLSQIMNHTKRQQAESYKGKTAKQVLSQWEDYLKMCIRLKKRVDDEMVYRPRELKRRHDEAVAEIALQEAKLQADEYSRRFPGAEDILKEIKEKFEYENEEYLLIVPERLVEIVAEGRALHHCAGSSDRYFDRIKQRETYICFLRKKAEPNTPYYTIEVEPGGTIRQHRGYLDEEPEIEKVKPFLREWQQVIKKRLNENDRKYAAISKVKREQNIEELKAKNNTRVLEGLMEDFMEVEELQEAI